VRTAEEGNLDRLIDKLDQLQLGDDYTPGASMPWTAAVQRWDLYVALVDLIDRAVRDPFADGSSAQAVRFIQLVRHEVGTKLLLVWDRLNVHRSAAKVLQRRADLPIEWLPRPTHQTSTPWSRCGTARSTPSCRTTSPTTSTTCTAR
jgi:hypothetical protein